MSGSFPRISRPVATCKPGKPRLTSFSKTLALFFIQFLSFRKMKVQDKQNDPSDFTRKNWLATCLISIVIQGACSGLIVYIAALTTVIPLFLGSSSMSAIMIGDEQLFRRCLQLCSYSKTKLKENIFEIYVVHNSIPFLKSLYLAVP